METPRMDTTPLSCHALRRFSAALLLLVILASVLMQAPAVRASVRFGDDRELLLINNINTYRSWNIEDKVTGESRTIRQLAIRLFGNFDIGETTDLVFYSSGGVSQNREEEVSEISGLADTKLKLFQQAWDRRALLGLGVNLPTGQTSLSDAELKASTSVAPNVLGFPMKRYGEGLDLDASVALGFEVGPGWAVGGGADYLFKGPYDLDPLTEYDPGDEYAVNLGADYRTDSWISTLDFVFRGYGTDKMNGMDSYADGNQLEFTLRSTWRKGKWGWDLSLRDVYKLESTIITSTGTPGSDTRVDNGNNLWLSLYPMYQPADKLVLRLIFDFVSVDQAVQQPVGAWAVDLGLGLEARLNDVTILDLRAAWLTGGDETGDLELSGLDGMIALRWQY